MSEFSDREIEKIKYWFEESLLILSLGPEEQVRANGPGCVTCDLYEEFKHRYEFVRDQGFYDLNFSDIGLTDLYETLEVLKDDEMVCFENEMLRTPGWNFIRVKAKLVCENLGINRKINPMVEIDKGIYSNNPDLIPKAKG